MNREGKSSMGGYFRVVMVEALSLNKLIATRSRSPGCVQRYILIPFQKESCGNFQGTSHPSRAKEEHTSVCIPMFRGKFSGPRAVTALAVVRVPVSPKYTLGSAGTKA